MKYILRAAVLIGLFALSAPVSHACSCLMPEVGQAFNAAHAVFIGEVVEIVRPRTDHPDAPLAERLYRVRFKVEKSYKGAGFQDVTVRGLVVLSDQGRGGCFSWGSFIAGRKYLVYAEETKDKNLAVLFSCNRTTALANAAKEVKELEKLSRSAFLPPAKSSSRLRISSLRPPE